MKKAHVLSIFCTLLFLFTVGSALGQVYTPAECGSKLDPANCCDRAADEATRIDTAQSILMVNTRDEGGVLDDDHYHLIINYWAVNGSGEDGVGEDGAVYQESMLSNFSRQEMWDYLDVIFGWSSDMELTIYDEIWETHPDGSMTYMLVNKWFGTTETGPYAQPGISIVKFRPGEGCAAYQRDYFSEGDTWTGIAAEMPYGKRETVIAGLGLADKCVDDDGDGYTKYAAAAGCANEGLDCNDFNDVVNPGATEILNNGIDDDCDPETPDEPTEAWGPASTVNSDQTTMAAGQVFLLFVFPAAFIFVVRRRVTRK
jgi:hypothetical protein